MFCNVEEQTCVKAMCNRSGQASLAAAPIEVLSGLKKGKVQTRSHLS